MPLRRGGGDDENGDHDGGSDHRSLRPDQNCIYGHTTKRYQGGIATSDEWSADPEDDYSQDGDVWRLAVATHSLYKRSIANRLS